MKTVRFMFNDEMARAIVEGRKTVTRRPVDFRKLPHGVIEEREGFGPWPFWEDEAGDWHPETRQTAPGDILIGRECWQYAHPEYHSEDEGIRLGKPMDSDGRWCWYRADNDGMESGDHEDCRPRWRPSIHMPDWAARIRRRVVSVTVEQAEDDAGVYGWVWRIEFSAENVEATP